MLELGFSRTATLRKRYYQPTTGQFNRLDPFAGALQDPQGLHKYLYAQANPIAGIDPTGLFTLPELAVTVAGISVLAAIIVEVYGRRSAVQAAPRTVVLDIYVVTDHMPATWNTAGIEFEVRKAMDRGHAIAIPGHRFWINLIDVPTEPANLGWEEISGFRTRYRGRIQFEPDYPAIAATMTHARTTIGTKKTADLIGQQRPSNWNEFWANFVLHEQLYHGLPTGLQKEGRADTADRHHIWGGEQPIYGLTTIDNNAYKLFLKDLELLSKVD